MSGTGVAWQNVEDFVSVELGGLGPGKRGLVFVVDPEARLPWPEDGQATITDAAGSVWRGLSYRGNDMALRARFSIEQPTVIWIRPAPLEGPDSIDLTTLADLVSLADGFVDASLAGMLHRLLPSIPVPDAVAEWAPQAATDPPGFAVALRSVADFKGQPINKRHILSAAVCQASPRITPEKAWLDDASLPHLLASYVQLVSSDRNGRFRVAAGEAFQHVASLLPPSSVEHKPSDAAKLLLGISPEALIDHLYVLAAASRHPVPDVHAALANRGLAAPEVTAVLAKQPWLASLLRETADLINADSEMLGILAEDAERRLNAARLAGLQGLLGGHLAHWAEEPVAGVRLVLLAAAVDAGDRAFPAQAFVAEDDASLGVPKVRRAAQALRRVAWTLGKYTALLDKAPEADHLGLDGLVGSYVDGFATAQYDFDQAGRDLQSLSSVLGERKKWIERTEGIRESCSARLKAYNQRLAHLLQTNLSSLLSSRLSIHRWLPDTVGPLVQADANRRVWMLVFDGLRWDLWERVLRPELESAGWEVIVKPGLALLPTETGVCRRGLLSGVTPGAWMGMPSDESLVRAFFKKLAGGDEIPLVFRPKAADNDYFTTGSPRADQLNVWVFQTPDNYAHSAGGAMREVVAQFSTFLRTNLIPQLQSEIASDDVIMVATDHGFASIAGTDKQVVSFPADRVDDRFVVLEEGEGSSQLSGLEVVHPGLGKWCIAQGDTVFVALGGRAPTAGFRHGGATLEEMVVPLAQAQRRARGAQALLLELQGPSELQEDDRAQFTAKLTNESSQEIKGRLLFDTNLGNEKGMPLVLAAGAHAERTYEVTGREGIQWIRVRLIFGTAPIATRMSPVTVRLKPGIKLTGFEALDDDL